MLGGNKMSYIFLLPDIKNLRLFYVLTKYPLVYANALVSNQLKIITSSLHPPTKNNNNNSKIDEIDAAKYMCSAKHLRSKI